MTRPDVAPRGATTGHIVGCVATDGFPLDLVVSGDRIASTSRDGAVGGDLAAIPDVDGRMIDGRMIDGRMIDCWMIDGSGCTLTAGFIDTQLNGAVGVDLTNEPERIGEVAEFLVTTGVTSFLPTVISAPADQTAHAIEALTEYLRRRANEPSPRAARALGVHLEGPYLAPPRRGAHPLRNLRPPDMSEAGRWSAAGGVAMVTLAPELDGAHAVIADLTGRGVVVCAGHTQIDASGLADAKRCGVTGVTHLFNAMGPISAREPGPAVAVLDDSTLLAGLIVDGLHVDPAMVRLAWRCLGPNRIVLVTDAMSALGARPGNARIGETAVVVGADGARTADGVLAGSVLRMDDAVRNVIRFTGCSIEAATAAAAATPAALLGRDDLGTIRSGALADLVLLDAAQQVVLTMVGGQVVHDPQSRLTSPPTSRSPIPRSPTPR